MPALERLPSGSLRTGGSNIRHHGTIMVFRWVESWLRFAREESTRIIGPDADPTLSGGAVSTIDTITNSLVAVYVSQVSVLSEIERIFWRREGNRIRVWTLINEPNEMVENQIAKAEMELMDTLPDYAFDFSVIFRQDKAPEHIGPQGAVLVYSKA